MKLLLAMPMLIAVWLVPVAQAADIREDMAAVDRAYIPLLALTIEGRPDEAFKAIRPLQRAWTAFRERHYKAKTKDAAWRKDLDLVDSLFYEANAILDGKRHLGLAQPPLERARVAMMDLRRRNGIDYYLDHLTAFHEPMAGILLAAKGKEPADAAGRIRALFPTATEAWGRALAAKPGAEFRLTAAQRERLQSRLDAETAALDGLRKALEANDRAAILAAAAGIKAPFDLVYYSFGDFHGFLWEEAANRKP